MSIFDKRANKAEPSGKKPAATFMDAPVPEAQAKTAKPAVHTDTPANTQSNADGWRYTNNEPTFIEPKTGRTDMSAAMLVRQKQLDPLHARFGTANLVPLSTHREPQRIDPAERAARKEEQMSIAQRGYQLFAQMTGRK